jgi:hypothetical protein
MILFIVQSHIMSYQNEHVIMFSWHWEIECESSHCPHRIQSSSVCFRPWLAPAKKPKVRSPTSADTVHLWHVLKLDMKGGLRKVEKLAIAAHNEPTMTIYV